MQNSIIGYIIIKVSIINISDFYDFSEIEASIAEHKPYETLLQGPTDASREFINKSLLIYLQKINRTSSHNLLCLCMEEIISNCVKANVKRAYFIHNELDINDHEQYEIGMKDFREMGVGLVKQLELITCAQDLGFYVKIRYEIENDIFKITTRNNSIISPEELSRIQNKIDLSKNKSSEEIFMDQVDMTEGCGLGIIMIKKIMEQISNLKDSFSIYADDKDTITELRLDMKKD